MTDKRILNNTELKYYLVLKLITDATAFSFYNIFLLLLLCGCLNLTYSYLYFIVNYVYVLHCPYTVDAFLEVIKLMQKLFSIIVFQKCH